MDLYFTWLLELILCLVNAYVQDFNHVLKNLICLRWKEFFVYLSGTIDLGLWHPKGTHIDLNCYLDADFAGYKVNRESTSGTCHFLGHSLVS